jgi:hypothetical protein
VSDLNTEFIRQTLGVMTARDISRKLGITVWDVHKIGKELGIKYRYCKPRVVWMTSMDKVIREHYPKKSASAVARMLGLDRRDVFRRALAIGVKRENSKPMTRWTTSMDRKVREFYPTMNTKELAAAMGIDIRALTGRASRLKVRKIFGK